MLKKTISLVALLLVITCAALPAGRRIFCNPKERPRRPLAQAMQIADEAQNLNEDPPKNDKTFYHLDAESLDTWLDSVRRQHSLPAMGAIVFRADSVLARGIAGVRRANAPDPAELSDRFQLGSNTKAITATVAATLVE